MATREGVLATDVEPVNVAQVAREAWEYVDTDSATFEGPKELRLDADADRLLWLFENLFRNSVEHGSTGPDSQARQDSVEHGSTSSRPAADDAAAHGRPRGVTGRLEATADGFAVSDDGPGIDPGLRDRIFDPGVSDAAGGTGFGLYIVHTIATAHGWDVTVTDAASGGARFEVSV